MASKLNAPFNLAQATDDDLKDVRRLFLEYQDAIGFSLCFQGFQQELDTLPGKYAEPRGALLIARDRTGEAVGVVALRPTDRDGICEMKRLFVSPTARGTGLGRHLLDAVLAGARKRGYKKICLDTVLGKMDRAIAMYRAEGFYEVPPYYENPMEGVLYLEKVL